MSSAAAGSQDFPPERPRSRREYGLHLTPLIPPRAAVEYTKISSAHEIIGRSGLPAARLAEVPSQFNEIAVMTLPITEPSDNASDATAFRVVSSVRYRGAGQELVIVTYQLFPEAEWSARDFANLGDRLSDGTPARVAVVKRSHYPNRAVFEKANFMIVLGSNLPLDEIKRLAVVLR